MAFRSFLVFILTAFFLLESVPAFAQDADEEEVCPYAGKELTQEELAAILEAHKAWVEQEGWNDPSIPGRAILCEANLEFKSFLGGSLNGIVSGANLRSIDLKGADLTGAFLAFADLRDADLKGAYLGGAFLSEADLSGADLSGANLRNANLYRADLSSADLEETNLKDVILIGVNMSNVSLSSIDLEGVIFSEVNLKGVYYNPPTDPKIINAVNLRFLWFSKGQHSAIFRLRKALEEEGLRDLEREATFALENGKTQYLLYGRHPNNPGREGMPTIWSRFSDQPLEVSEGIFRTVMFEWTTEWGFRPSRALWIMVGLFGLMTFIYIFPILKKPNSKKESGIYKVWPKGRLVFSKKGPESAGEEVMERLSFRGIKAFGWALYFSLLSATTIGWRELNVGNWISRVQPKEFGLRGRGWVRVVSGAQSLISVYLIAIWALTYFGRPFQ